jgi:hypothetical protein
VIKESAKKSVTACAVVTPETRQDLLNFKEILTAYAFTTGFVLRKYKLFIKRKCTLLSYDRRLQSVATQQVEVSF